MDILQQCRTKRFPNSIAFPREFQYVVDIYAQRLETLQPRLFGEESQACVHLWQCQEDGCFSPKVATDLSHLRSHLEVPTQPRCRFVFVGTRGRSSREKLNITIEMMSEILTYHQVMTPFVNLLASFGRDAPKDFQSCGFRSDMRLSVNDRALAIPELGRSGQVLELCYSLRAVEPSTSYLDWPYSIKPLAIAHSFDFGTGQSIWVVLKADDLMKERIVSATRSAGLPDVTSFKSVGQSLASSLSVHLIVCEWAAEHCRWYVNYLEKQVQEITGTRVFSTVSAPSSPRLTQGWTETIQPPMRSGSFPFPRRLSRSSTWGSVRRTLGLSKGSDSALTGQALANSGSLQGGSGQFPSEKSDSTGTDEDGFSPKDLQHIQFVEEKINEALLVQATTNKILQQLQNFYETLQQRPELHNRLSQDCKLSLARFYSRIENIQFDLDLQCARAETLVTLLANRKNLLGQIMDWRSTEAIKMISKQSHASTEHMEFLSVEMRELAVKTKQETVSMRIITLVTLFYLPGTFISTLMSTDIIQYDHSKEIFSFAALKLFLAISLPAMFLTFLAWYAVYWYVNNREMVAKWKKQLAPPTGDEAA